MWPAGLEGTAYLEEEEARMRGQGRREGETLFSGLCPPSGNPFLFQSHKDVSKSFSVFFFFLGMHPQHMEVPRPGVELELQLPASTTATQCRILSPLSEVRD